jgi:hypothetical protein
MHASEKATEVVYQRLFSGYSSDNTGHADGVVLECSLASLIGILKNLAKKFEHASKNSTPKPLYIYKFSYWLSINGLLENHGVYSRTPVSF